MRWPGGAGGPTAVETDGEYEDMNPLGNTLGSAEAGAVFIREYDGGRLLLEDALRPGELGLVFGQAKSRRTERHNRRKRRVPSSPLSSPTA